MPVKYKDFATCDGMCPYCHHKWIIREQSADGCGFDCLCPNCGSEGVAYFDDYGNAQFTVSEVFMTPNAQPLKTLPVKNTDLEIQKVFLDTKNSSNDFFLTIEQFLKVRPFDEPVAGYVAVDKRSNKIVGKPFKTAEDCLLHIIQDA